MTMAEIFDFSHFPALETERLRLRRMTFDDAAAFVRLYTDPEVGRFLIIDPPCVTLDDGRWWVNWWNDHFIHQRAMRWAITVKDGPDEMIGTCGFHFWSREHRRTDIGYDLQSAYWRQGYITEAAHTLIGWCFENLDLHRVQADCTAGNIGSERVLEKLGFTLEGTWRENIFEHGHFVNIRQYGLLRREYRG